MNNALNHRGVARRPTIAKPTAIITYIQGFNISILPASNDNDIEHQRNDTNRNVKSSDDVPLNGMWWEGNKNKPAHQAHKRQHHNQRKPNPFSRH
jgi:hypothetical protein